MQNWKPQQTWQKHCVLGMCMTYRFPKETLTCVMIEFSPLKLGRNFSTLFVNRIIRDKTNRMDIYTFLINYTGFWTFLNQISGIVVWELFFYLYYRAAAFQWVNGDYIYLCREKNYWSHQFIQSHKRWYTEKN